MRDYASEVRQAAINGMSKRGASRSLGISYNAVDKHWPADDEINPDPVDAAIKASDREAKRSEHVNAVKELAFRRFLESLVSENVPPIPKKAVQKAPKRTINPHRRDALLVLTDWHFEENVKSEGVLGLNSYDIDTACRRVNRVVKTACDWRRDIEAGGRFEIPELTVALLGDFLTGTLHGLEKHTDPKNIVRSALLCGDLLSMALLDLAEAFPVVKVVGVSGNHGRLPDDRKVPTKDPTRSWDYLAYQVARRRLSNSGNISFFLPEAYGCIFEVAGHLCYASHGNFIPNNLGVVGYGVRRFAAALASNLNAAGKQLRYCFFGHWHQSNSSEFAGMQCFICPSLIGTQEYSFLSGGSVNRPAQHLFVFDKELGMTSNEVLYGDGGGHAGRYELEV